MTDALDDCRDPAPAEWMRALAKLRARLPYARGDRELLASRLGLLEAFAVRHGALLLRAGWTFDHVFSRALHPRCAYRWRGEDLALIDALADRIIMRFDDQCFTIRHPRFSNALPQRPRATRGGEPPELSLAYPPAPDPTPADGDDDLPF